MGDDYVRYIAVELLRRFRQQIVVKTLAIKCEERPRLLTSADERTCNSAGRSCSGVQLASAAPDFERPVLALHVPESSV